MLKLERTAHNQHIAIAIKDREYLFTQPFQLALAIAIGIHLFFLLLFQITPIQFNFRPILFPPTTAEAILGSESGLIAAPLNEKIPAKYAFLEREDPKPHFQEIPHFHRARQMVAIQEKEKSENPFFTLEQEVYQPKFPPHITPRHLPPISFVISGSLASKTLLHPLIQDLFLSPPVQEPFSGRIIYSVLVEEKTGEILWYEAIQRSDTPSLNAFAEDLLALMRFEKQLKSPWMISGVIEMHFRENQS